MCVRITLQWTCCDRCGALYMHVNELHFIPVCVNELHSNKDLVQWVWRMHVYDCPVYICARTNHTQTILVQWVWHPVYACEWITLYLWMRMNSTFCVNESTHTPHSTRIHMHTRTHTHKHTHAHTKTHTHTHTHTCTHAHTHMRTRARTHTNTHPNK